MNLLHMLRNCFAATAFALVGAAASAGEGHDHGDEAPGAASGPASPRFTTASELFELVGVIDGKRLTVYLDHAATNQPVKDAKLELEIGGVKVAVKPHAEGEFDAELVQPIKPGVFPVTATVSAGKDSDLLAGELDVHDDTPKPAVSTAMDWMRLLAWAVGGVVALLVLSLAIRMALRRRGASSAVGGAA